jgi:hypothetical protein
MFEKTKSLVGSWRALSFAMRIPLLIFAVSIAASLQLEPVVDRVAALLTSRAKTAISCDPRVMHLRQELAGVQMEMMDVMGTDGHARAQLRAREAGLKYELREAEIKCSESPRSAEMPRS